MDVTRAQEILQSNQEFRVMRNGVPVWIEEVDEKSKTVRVHTEGNQADSKVVSVYELQEG